MATIIVFTMLSYWLATNFFFSLFDNGSFRTSTSTHVTQMSNGTFPVYEMERDQLFVAYRINSFRDDLEIDRYVNGVWLQIKPDHSTKVYKPMPCPKVFESNLTTIQFDDQVHDMLCADMQDDKILLQNTGKEASLGHGWYFIIDTCEQLSKYTGNTNCIPDSTVWTMMNEFIVTTKIAT